MAWQDEPATEKQIASFERMKDQLGETYLHPYPWTKGEIGPLIGDLKNKVAVMEAKKDGV